MFDSTIRYDASFFDHLDRIVQKRAVARARPRDDRPAEVAGHREGQARSRPTRATKQALDAGAARQAGAELAAKYDAGLPPFFEGTHWTVPAHPELIKAAADGFTDPDSYPDRLARPRLQLRLHRHQAAGLRPVLPDQRSRTRTAQIYDGAKTYRAARAAERAGRAVLVADRLRPRDARADQGQCRRASRASNAAEVQQECRRLDRASSWAEGTRRARRRTGFRPIRARKFELIFRLYAPTKEFFDKKWVLPDVEKLATP